MTEVQVGEHVGVGDEIVRVQETQGGRLHRAAQKKRRFLQRIGQVGHDQLAHLAAAGAVQHQAKGALVIVLADEDNGAVKKRTQQVAAVQQQLAFEGFFLVAHRHGQCASRKQTWQKENHQEKNAETFVSAFEFQKVNSS